MTSIASLNNQIYKCTKCPDCVKTRMYAMPGFIGQSDIRLAIIGQNPGLPQRGEKERLINLNNDYETHYSIGLKNCLVGTFINHVCETLNIGWKNIFFSNIIKCATPQCRMPSEVEVGNCIGYLRQQLQIIQPKCVLFLGQFPGLILNDKYKVFTYYIQIDNHQDVKYINIYHPTYIRRIGDKLLCRTLGFIKKAYNL